MGKGATGPYKDEPSLRSVLPYFAPPPLQRGTFTQLTEVAFESLRVRALDVQDPDVRAEVLRLFPTSNPYQVTLFHTLPIASRLFPP